jgi:methionine--tRNA ligase beta chain
MWKLFYNPIDQFELPGFIKFLNPFNEAIEIEESNDNFSLSNKDLNILLTSRREIACKLGQLSFKFNCNCKSNSEDFKFLCSEQLFNFTFDSVIPSLKVNQPDSSVIFDLLQNLLGKSTFLCGNELCPIDALMYSLLYNRIKSFVPSIGNKYFRLIRWFNQVQHDLVLNSTELTSEFPIHKFDLSVFSNYGNDSGLSKKLSKALSYLGSAKKETKSEVNKSNKDEINSQNLPLIARVDLRIGKIVQVEKHPNADRLYIEKVDFGEAELRTVVSGLVEHVPLEDLKDRMCLFICNLKPAMICKVQSTAMLLVGKEEIEGGLLEPLIIPDSAKPGDSVCIDGITPSPDKVIKPAKDSVWELIRPDLTVIDGVAHYKESKLKIIGNQSDFIISNKVKSGIIS